MPGHVHRPTIRFFEVDQQRVVYHMWYLAYFEDARNEMLAKRGLPLRSLQGLGLDLQVVHYELDWLGPVRWEDELRIVTDVANVRNTSFRLRFQAMVGERQAAVGESVYVVIDSVRGCPTQIPGPLRAALGAVAT
jgi:acyl-CoA thioester hydrolase